MVSLPVASSGLSLNTKNSSVNTTSQRPELGKLSTSHVVSEIISVLAELEERRNAIQLKTTLKTHHANM